ncbi:MAG: methylated-DNA--[protein]-cysteine S-methyltransferase, partial [Flavobacteriaceae bacterium]
KQSKNRIVVWPRSTDFCSMENTHHFTVIEKAIGFINDQSIDQPSLDAMADHVHMSKYHFQRLFKKWAGISPKEFLQFLTLEHAKSALKKGKSTLETAYDVGLSGNGRLHDLFVKIEACTPGEYRKRGKDLELKLGNLDTPFGVASIAETHKGINRLSFGLKSELRSELIREYPLATINDGLGPNGKKIDKYFKDWQRPDGKISLDIQGSPFQIQVWKALLRIPSTQLVAYGDIAGTIKKPGSSRAVGTAVGNNPIAYLIPCHRVIRNSGETGNYRWGANRKAAINAYEAVTLSDTL